MFFSSVPIVALSASFKYEAREIWAVGVLRRAIASAGLSEKEAAFAQGVSQPQWSRQCSCQDGAHASYPRMMRLPATVIASVAKELYEEFSGGGICIAHADLQRVVRSTERIAAAGDRFDRLAEALEAREQLTMTLRPKADRRISA